MAQCSITLPISSVRERERERERESGRESYIFHCIEASYEMTNTQNNCFVKNVAACRR